MLKGMILKWVVMLPSQYFVCCGEREIYPETVTSERYRKALENLVPLRLFSLSLGESGSVLNSLKWLFSQGGVYKNNFCSREDSG